MSQEQNARGKALKVFRLGTEAVVSVLDLGGRVHIGPVDFIPLDSESRLRLAFESAGLIPRQVVYALQKLAGTANHEGFVVFIDHSQPSQ